MSAGGTLVSVPSTGGGLLLHSPPSIPVFLLLSPVGRDSRENKVLGAEIAAIHVACPIPPLLGDNSGETRLRWALRYTSHMAEMVPRVSIKPCRIPVENMCSPPQNEVPLKVSGSFSREQLYLCHTKVSVPWQGTEMCPQCWCGWGWKAGRSPLRLLSLGLPAFPCSQPGPAAAQLFPQQGWGCSGSRTWPGLSPLWGWPPVLVRRGNRLLLLLPLGCFCSGWQWNLSLTPS